MSSNNQKEEPTSIVDVHDPFFLWGLLEYSDETLLRADQTLEEDDRSHLYWSCYYYNRTQVCDYILQNHEPIRKADEAIKKLSEITKAGAKNEPDLSEIAVPFPLPTTPAFIVHELRDGSFISSKGKPLKFTAVDKDGKTKT